jgi:hypothetical protein
MRVADSTHKQCVDDCSSMNLVHPIHQCILFNLAACLAAWDMFCLQDVKMYLLGGLVWSCLIGCEQSVAGMRR